MPMIRLDCVYPLPVELKVGDVLMVHQEIEPEGEKPFTWKYFAAVCTEPIRRRFACIIGILVLDEKDRKTKLLNLEDHRYSVWYIPPEEWPDGVYAFRTRFILEGRLDEAVLG